ncbi:MAG: hypothetical protein KDH09_11920 [Chrysiogenetes bacterium]|nr:hypothetical protein [Chrysiogenetes bacterium]
MDQQIPRNRHERRAAESAARRARASGARSAPDDPGPIGREGPAAPPLHEAQSTQTQPRQTQPPETSPDSAGEGKESPRGLERHYLEIYGRIRGPLFENPRAVVCRVIALSAVSRLCRAGTERSLRVRAARVLDEALAEVPDSNRPATGEAFARASAALVDVSRAVRGWHEGQDLPGTFVEIFARHCGKLGEIEHMRHYAWGELLAAIFLTGDDALCLRAARTLLSRTRSEARKVGYERPIEKDPEACQVIADARAERAGGAPSRGGAEERPAPTGGEPAWSGGYECSGAGPP